MSIKREGERALHGVRERVAQKLNAEESKISVSQYIPENIERKEGDIWTDAHGKKWTVKNGIKQSISTLQEARVPLWCPKCELAMTHRFDTKMYHRHGMCFDCVVKMETKLRLEGKFEEYEQKMVRNNEISYLKRQISMVQSALDELKKPEFVLESGEIERWDIDLTKVRRDAEADLAKMRDRLEKLEALT